MNLRLYTIIFLTAFMFYEFYLQTKFDNISIFSFQQNKDSINTLTIENEKALFDVHLALSLINGFRIGSRLFFLKYYSVEISYGVNGESFGGGDGGHIIGLGINWYPLKNYSVAFNLSGYANIRYHYKYYYIISPNFGFLTSRDKGFRFHVLMGMSVIISRNESSNDTSTKLKPNVEIGFGIGF